MCLKICTVLVLLIATLIGLLLSGQLAEFGAFQKLDEVSPLWVGTVPTVLTKQQRQKFSFDEIPDLTGRVSLVTGANSGLGYYIALHLARKGSTVVMSCRTLEKCEVEAKKIRANSTKIGKVVSMEVDLSSLSSVEKFSKAFREKFDRLDHVILNAGIVQLLNSKPDLSADNIELGFATNHLGHFKLYLDLADLIEKTAKNHGISTVTHVSSSTSYYVETLPLNLKQVNNETGFNGRTRYAETKLANILFSDEIARRMAKKNITVLSNSVHPGWVATRLARDVTDKKGTVFGAELLERVNQMVAWTPELGSLTPLFAAVSPTITKNKISGKYFHPIAIPLKPNKFATEENSKKLWQFGLELLHSKGYNKNNTI